MAADTALKRYSAMNISCPWRGLNVVPQAASTGAERAAAMFLYSGVSPSQPGGGAATDFIHAHTKSGMGCTASSGFVGVHT